MTILILQLSTYKMKGVLGTEIEEMKFQQIQGEHM